MKKALLILVLFSSLIHFGQDGSNIFDLGKVEDRIYSNAYLGVHFPIPDGWKYKMDEDQTVMKEGLEAIDRKLEKEGYTAFDPDDVNSSVLITISRYATGAAVPFNYNLLLMVENVSHIEGIKTGADYLSSARLLMKYISPNTKVKSKFTERQLGERTFYGMHSKSSMLGVKYKQIMYSTVIQDFVFSIIVTYSKKEHLTELNAAVNQIRIDH